MSNGPPPSQEALLRMQQQEEEARKNAPKEMIAKRTKNSKKFVTPSGIYQTKTYPRAIHVKNDRGGWDGAREEVPGKPILIYAFQHCGI